MIREFGNRQDFVKSLWFVKLEDRVKFNFKNEPLKCDNLGISNPCRLRGRNVRHLEHAAKMSR